MIILIFIILLAILILILIILTKILKVVMQKPTFTTASQLEISESVQSANEWLFIRTISHNALIKFLKD